ncbi:MAG: tim-barrel domain-containing protein [Linnemannia gamsii]|nr:MAG: tim-barrel domain-containing protein [Linnemannia gamsii]
MTSNTESSKEASSSVPRKQARTFCLVALIVVTTTFSALFTVYSINNKGALENYKLHSPSLPSDYYVTWNSTTITHASAPQPSSLHGHHTNDNATTVAAVTTVVTPLEDLVKRLLPDPYHTHFRFKLRTDLTTNSETNVHDTFRLYNLRRKHTAEATIAKVAIEGATLSALGAGLNHYLKHVCKVELTWSGHRFDQLPVVPPLIPTEAGVDGVVRASFVPWRYYMNVVTYGYSFAFWDWNRWQRELDWIMLNGVNMVLAMVGQEYVVRKFYENQGLTPKDIDNFLAGPAFMPWQRMGNIQGAWALQRNTTFNNDWIDSQWALQGQIMQRLQAFNITPIMPSFQGFVPRKLPEIYPNSSFVTASNWNEMGKYSQVTALLPTEPLFITLSQQFIQLQRTMYNDIGIDLDVGAAENFYLLDLYNEMQPSCTEPACLKDISAGVMRAMKAADPKAVWTMQGWFLVHLYPWQPAQNEAFFDGIKQVNEGRDAFVIDLNSEVMPVWERTDGFFGTSWGWSMLDNFGGGQGLYGALPTLLREPFKGYQQRAKSMRGMGITMEGIENNEYLYQLVLDIPWQSVEATYPDDYPAAAAAAKHGAYPLKQQALSGKTHLEEFIKRRYGPDHTTPAMLEAWTTLSQTVWDCRTKQDSQSKTFLDNAPRLDMVKHGFMRTVMWYDQNKVVAAWKQLVDSTETEQSRERRRRHSVIQDSIEAVIKAAIGRSSEIASPMSSSVPSMWASAISDWIQDTYQHILGRINPRSSDRRDIVESSAVHNSTLSTQSEPLPLNVSSFRYDLVDVTREVLVGVVLPGLHRELVDAYEAKDLNRTQAWGQHVLDVILDIDRLLSTHTHFMVGPWIRDARISAKVVATSTTATALTPASMNHYQDYLEYNARNQITWWAPHGQDTLADYASKHWGGLVKEFYYPRWRIFVDHLVSAVETGNKLNQTACLSESLVKEIEWMKETTCLGGCFADSSLEARWRDDPHVTTKYPVEAVEDTVLVAQDLMDRWGLIAMRLAKDAKPVRNEP